MVVEGKTSRLEAAIDLAIGGAGMDTLLDVLARNSHLPGTKPNLDFAKAAGVALASRRGKSDAIVRELLMNENEFPVIVAAHALVERVLAGVDVKGSMTTLHDLADEPRHLVRMGIVAAVRALLFAKGDEILRELVAWTDGYFHAHVVLSALADRDVLDKLRSPDELIARLDEAFVLADTSPRAAERTQGLRSLREGFPAEVVVLAARFPEVITWVESKTDTQRPESREVVAQMIAALRRRGLKNSEADRLETALGASAKPLRYAARVVHGTRKRSKGRR